MHFIAMEGREKKMNTSDTYKHIFHFIIGRVMCIRSMPCHYVDVDDDIGEEVIQLDKSALSFS